MNLKQKICLWVGVAIVALAATGAFLQYYKDRLSTHTGVFNVSVHVRELTIVETFVLLVGVIVVTMAVILITFLFKKPKDEQKQ